MISVLLESHHLYYLPHFEPIVAELNRRGGYEIAASIPLTIGAGERRLFYEAVQRLGVESITATDEEARIDKLRQREFDIVIVGNVGKLEEIAAENSMVVMVYHGIGLKQSYYKGLVEYRLNGWFISGLDRFISLFYPWPLSNQIDRTSDT